MDVVLRPGLKISANVIVFLENLVVDVQVFKNGTIVNVDADVQMQSLPVVVDH